VCPFIAPSLVKWWSQELKLPMSGFTEKEVKQYRNLRMREKYINKVKEKTKIHIGASNKACYVQSKLFWKAMT